MRNGGARLPRSPHKQKDLALRPGRKTRSFALNRYRSKPRATEQLDRREAPGRKPPARYEPFPLKRASSHFEKAGSRTRIPYIAPVLSSLNTVAVPVISKDSAVPSANRNRT